MTLEQITELIEECRRLDSALVIDPDVVAALVRVALAAEPLVDAANAVLFEGRYGQTSKMEGALALLDGSADVLGAALADLDHD